MISAWSALILIQNPLFVSPLFCETCSISLMQLLCLFSISPHFPRYFSLLPLHFFFPLLHLCRLLFILSHPNVWPRSSFNALSKQLSNLEENQEHRRRSRKKILVEKNQARSRLMVIILGRKPRLILEENMSDLLCCDQR